MKIHTDSVKSWEQLSLVPADVLEVTFVATVDRRRERCDFSVRITEGDQANVVLLTAVPLVDFPDSEAQWSSLLREVVDVLREATSPF